MNPPLREINLGGGAMHAARSPDGRQIAFACWDRNVWILDDDGTVRTVIDLGTWKPGRLAYSPDGRLLVVGGEQERIMMLDVAEAEVRYEFLRPERGYNYIQGVGFSADGRLVFSSETAAGGARIWDAEFGRMLDHFPLDPQSSPRWWRMKNRVFGETLGPCCQTVSPDGTCLILGMSDRTIRVFDLATRQLRQVLEGHRSMVVRVACVVGNRLVSCEEKGPLRIWDLDSARPLGVLEKQTSEFRGLAVSPDGTQIATTTGFFEKPIVRTWDVATMKARSPLGQFDNPIFAIAYSSDGKRLFTGTRNGRILIWDTSGA